MRKFVRGLVLVWVLSAGAAGAASEPSYAWFTAGVAALEKENYAEARRALERAIVADPKNARAFGYLGYTRQQMGELDKAQKYYRIALKIEPDQIEALNWSGQADVSVGEIDEAQEKLGRLRRLCGPTCPEYKQLERSVSYYKSKQSQTE